MVSLALWGLAGLALVLLPGLLAQSQSKSTETPLIQNPKASITTLGPSTGTSQGSNTSGSNAGGDFLLRLLIIIIPALSLSVLGGTWVSGRIRRATV
jgi:hypothetical protein